MKLPILDAFTHVTRFVDFILYCWILVKVLHSDTRRVYFYILYDLVICFLHLLCVLDNVFGYFTFVLFYHLVFSIGPVKVTFTPESSMLFNFPWLQVHRHVHCFSCPNRELSPDWFGSQWRQVNAFIHISVPTSGIISLRRPGIVTLEHYVPFLSCSWWIHVWVRILCSLRR